MILFDEDVKRYREKRSSLLIGPNRVSNYYSGISCEKCGDKGMLPWFCAICRGFGFVEEAKRYSKCYACFGKQYGYPCCEFPVIKIKDS